MKKILLLALALFAASSISFTALAQGTPAPQSGEQNLTTLITNTTKAIDNRITALNNTMKRFDSVKRLTDADKTAIKTAIQSSIDNLTALKTKIAADTDMATLKADVQLATVQYRSFALLMPRAMIMAAADRVQLTAAMMDGVSKKLKARILQAPAGTDTSSLQTAIIDLDNRVASAISKALSAVSLVADLKPDLGDKDIAASNLEALKAAKTKVQEAHKDLAAARKDITIVLKGIKEFSKPATEVPTAATPNP